MQNKTGGQTINVRFSAPEKLQKKEKPYEREKQMKKVLVLLLAVMMLASLAACSETITTESKAPSEAQPASEQEGFADVLTMINKDEIYFDIHLSDGIFDKTSVKVGDKVLSSSGKAAYTGSETITFEGKSDKDTDIKLVIISLTVGEKAMTDYSTCEASMLPNMIAQRIPIDKKGKDKVLVIVTDTNEYDHSFDAAVSDLIKAALG